MALASSALVAGEVGLGGVEIVLRRHLATAQFADAVEAAELRLRLLHAGLGLEDLGAGGFERGLVLLGLRFEPGGVQPGHHLADLDRGVVVHVHRLDGAGDLDADVHFLERLQGAGGAHGDDEVAAFGGLGDILHGLRLPAQHGEEQDCDQQRGHGPKPPAAAARFRVRDAERLGDLFGLKCGSVAHGYFDEAVCVAAAGTALLGVQPPPRAL